MFAQINQGTDITKGLRKVDKSEKNPTLRGNAPIAASPSSSVHRLIIMKSDPG